MQQAQLSIAMLCFLARSCALSLAVAIIESFRDDESHGGPVQGELTVTVNELPSRTYSWQSPRSH